MSKPEVIGGKLKLKGSSGSISSISGNKRQREAEEEKKPADFGSKENPGDATSSSEKVEKKLSETEKSYLSGLTESQRRQREMRAAQQRTRELKKLATTTYRERLEQFNMKLATTTEHNDIPRTSAAGNG